MSDVAIDLLSNLKYEFKNFDYVRFGLVSISVLVFVSKVWFRFVRFCFDFVFQFMGPLRNMPLRYI